MWECAFTKPGRIAAPSYVRDGGPSGCAGPTATSVSPSKATAPRSIGGAATGSTQSAASTVVTRRFLLDRCELPRDPGDVQGRRRRADEDRRRRSRLADDLDLARRR